MKGPSLNAWPVDRYDMRLPWIDRRQFEQCSIFAGGHRGAGVSRVESSAPRRMRQAAERLGMYFRREFHYDFPPYEASSTDPRLYPLFVWADGDQLTHGQIPVIGAVGFNIEDRIPSKPWQLGWAWFHPYARRCGYLSHAWPYFRECFGDFILQFPLSEAMKSFLENHDPEAIARSKQIIETQSTHVGGPGASRTISQRRFPCATTIGTNA